ncbi:methyl-accepting chemotaxis protein [Brevundimonas sp.]|uniref:methyl-accepting chemotaxis protein n=1 Tax=Brevundimonas sp. TaxID=1871086 RepID=UPI002FC99615
MFTNLPVSRKLLIAFSAVLLAILAMGGVILFNLQAMERAGVTRSEANEAVRDTALAELKLARQENSLRGFLISNDPYYLQRLDAHRADFKQAVKEIREIPGLGVQAETEALEGAADEWFENVVTVARRLAADPSTRAQAIAMVGRQGSADTYIGKAEEAMEAIDAANVAHLEEAENAQINAARTALIALLVGLVAAVIMAIGAGIVITRALVGPINSLISDMRRLMQGDTSIEAPMSRRKDEFGQFGQAVLAFRDAAVEKLRLEAETAAERAAVEAERARNEEEKAREAEYDRIAITALAEGLAAMADGDLTHRFTAEVAPKAARLKEDFNRAVVQLEEAMAVVVTNVSAIRSGAGEISQAADDLSRRTEQQAASLEETAAALDEITATVNRTASGARQASETVKAAKGDAETSGVVVRDAVGAMGAIEKSAQEISQIIGVIDEIAFQTNLLALNAGVEAARAGDAGRGFAVVASEVRALAQRSAEAAKEIKVLISASTNQVNSGVSLVGQTGEALQRIVGRVAEIDGLVSEIAASAQEQATGLQQVNTAVNQMDQVTQQNAAMVEQSTAASHSLSQEAESLAGSVSRFRIGATPPAARTAARPAARSVTALKTLGRGGAALKPQAVEDGWEEF